MIKKAILAGVFLSLISSSFLWAEGQKPVMETEYKIGENDILQVIVLQPDKLDTELTVSPDGSITFPYIGSIKVKGLTLTEAQQRIQKDLSDYMKYPVVAVSLKEARSRTFFVYGEVEKPGSFLLEKNMSIVQAISLAGGFKPVASMNNVKILRPNPDGSGSTTLTVDVESIVTGKKPDIAKVEPGDVITVTKRFF